MKKKFTPVIAGIIIAIAAIFGVAGSGDPTNQQETSQIESSTEYETGETQGNTESEENKSSSEIESEDFSSDANISEDNSQNLESKNQSQNTSFFDYSSIPEYSSASYVTVNNNVPYFASDEITTASYESYGSLDSLGRCTTAMACIGTDLFPTEERGEIGQIKPTGWHTVKYDGIDGNYLYNRCHLIMYAMTGENANEKNLITGTRYMNTEGMLPFEEKTHDYIESTNNHVMYRVTPVFVGEELLARGVLMEAYSVEDGGAGISFCIFCYNVQPGITINYSDGSSSGPEFTGSSSGSSSYGSSSSDSSSSNNIISEESTTTSAEATYIGNKNTGKYHRADCSSVSDMNEENKVFFSSKDEAEAAGYVACKRCNP